MASDDLWVQLLRLLPQEFSDATKTDALNRLAPEAVGLPAKICLTIS